jgi:hypothetical protein
MHSVSIAARKCPRHSRRRGDVHWRGSTTRAAWPVDRGPIARDLAKAYWLSFLPPPNASEGCLKSCKDGRESRIACAHLTSYALELVADQVSKYEFGNQCVASSSGVYHSRLRNPSNANPAGAFSWILIQFTIRCQSSRNMHLCTRLGPRGVFDRERMLRSASQSLSRLTQS